MGPPPYRLFRGDTLLGAVAALAPAQATGWFEGTLAPAPGWGSVAPLFQTAAQALKYADRFPDAWDEAFAAAQGPGVAVEDAAGRRWPVDAQVDGLTVRVQPR